jgi:predicted dehydrogenase
MLRAAVVGLGWWGKQIVKCLRESRLIRVTHGVDVAAPQLAAFAAEYGLRLGDSFEAMLGDPAVDAVVIATPHSMHEAQVLAAIAAGKQVFCEKPLTLTAAGAERILAACDRAGIVLGIGHERRFEPALERLAAAVRSGELGEIRHMEASAGHALFAAMDASNWRVNPKDAPAGAMTALGIHVTDLWLSLVGRPTRVWARTRRGANGREDHVSAQLDFASGATGALTCLSSVPFHSRIAVRGTRGWIEVMENANVDQGKPSDLLQSDAEGRRTSESYAPINTVLLNFEAWADAVAGRRPYRFTRDQLLDNVRVLDAIVTSAAEGSRTIEL